MKRTALSIALAGLLAPVGHVYAAPTVSFSKLWTFNHASANAGQTSEIPAFDAATNTLWVAGVNGFDVLSASTGSLVRHVDLSGVGGVNSVAIHNGLAAIAIENKADRTLPGIVQFYDTSLVSLSSGFYPNTVTVGALPDMLTFTKDGSKLLVANEATPNVYGAVGTANGGAGDPAGSVSIINVATRSVTNVGLAGVPVSGSAVRTNTGMDFEPEYITVSADGSKAWVTLQEANAVATLDLNANSFSSIVGLGTKDFSLAANAIDPNHKDKKVELRSANVRGFYQPDAIANYQRGGKTYLVMANEGDTREDDGDKLRAKESGLGGVPGDLKELNISTPDSTNGNLFTFGARSFSIRDEAGKLVYDSGNILDAEAIRLGIYDDGRSDDKGVEPEGVSLLEIGGRTIAFVGLERTTQGAVSMFDITDPNSVSYLDTIVTLGDVSPEGIVSYEQGGKYYLAIANEVSGTTSLYQVAAVPEPEQYAMLLAGLGLIGVAARRRQRA
ncbi:choice-of-anchor I family protein [Niveibacterium sp. 24ML]|uniref:choice-of-anchor I family protein n=1 Tax=Niveibacterium sp. 24ML TaxID=2985512 RepID=UPI00227201D9|nr:choice-of-anchor I family protein [Niveibacterium sp. 24ML]MCX9158016.1 choice-of-anchor I family protein [Niveibacterium sp. 24ML]